MDPRQAAIRRNAHYTRGPRFFRADDGAVMFEFVIDALNALGPRPANDGDRSTHGEAWAQFEKTDIAPIESGAFDIPDPPGQDAADAASLDAARKQYEGGTLETLSGDEVRANLGLDLGLGQPAAKRAYQRRKAQDDDLTDTADATPAAEGA